MKTVANAGPADVIALVWFQLGYRPRDSIVLVGLEGPRLRSGLLMRADLPPADVRRRDLQAMASRLTGTVMRGGARSVLVLVMEEQIFVRRPRLVGPLLHALRRRGVEVVDLLGVTATAFRSLRCADATCCPPGGTPLDAVMSSAVAAEFVLAGDTVARSEQELVADVVPAGTVGGEAPEPGVETPVVGVGPAGIGAEGLDVLTARRSWWRDWLTALDAGAIEPSAARRLAVALDDLPLRDAVLVTAVESPPDEIDVLLEPQSFEEACALFDQGGVADMWRLLAKPPDADRLARARAVLAAAARHGPAGHRGPALAVLAWLAWYSGDGARARLLVERAVQDQPDNTLGRLVGDLLEALVPPPWVRIPAASKG